MLAPIRSLLYQCPLMFRRWFVWILVFELVHFFQRSPFIHMLVDGLGPMLLTIILPLSKPISMPQPAADLSTKSFGEQTQPELLPTVLQQTDVVSKPQVAKPPSSDRLRRHCGGCQSPPHLLLHHLQRSRSPVDTEVPKCSAIYFARIY